VISSIKQKIFSIATQTCDIEDTIVVAGTGRSGTTWVGELLRVLPEYKLLNEPLGIVSNPEAEEAGFRQRTYLVPDADRPQLYSYMRTVLQGRVPHSWKYRFSGSTPLGILAEHVRGRKVIVKFTRALRLLRWINHQFDIRGTVLLIRHPCAVIASMLKHGGWGPAHLENRGDTPLEQALGGPIPDELYGRFAPSLEGIESHIDILAHMWALDYHVALFGQGRFYPWVLVPYERLVMEKIDELKRILNVLGVPISSEMKERFNRASSSASSDLKTEDALDQLSKWKKDLSGAEIDRILDIAHNFGVDFYSRDLHPDYDRLLECQMASTRPAAS